MTLVIIIDGRNVQIGIGIANKIVEQIDATWLVGSGRTFLWALRQLLLATGSELGAIERIVVSASQPSDTTIRIVLVTLNSLTWLNRTPVILIEKLNKNRSLKALLKAAAHQATESGPLFPKYE